MPPTAVDPTLPVDTACAGWREWIALPGLGIPVLKAKLDTGARSSSLHVQDIETFRVDGALHVRFRVRLRRRTERYASCTAAVADRRSVTDSGGHRSERWFVLAEIVAGSQRYATEINLTDRHAMLFPLLIGRSALAGRFRVDPDRSYTWPRPARAPPILSGHR